MLILAHRGNIKGPSGAAENSVELYRRALELGFGLEIDLRRSLDGRFFISHDPASISAANELGGYAALFAAHPTNIIAVNVKELGYEPDLVRLRENGAFGAQSFYFDFELLEPENPGRAQRAICVLPEGPRTRLAARVSDHGESIDQCLAIPALVVWADEFDRPWLTSETIAKIHAAGRLIYTVSPELHGFDRGTRLARWADFRHWNIDGLCTDYACEAQNFFND